MGPLDSRLQSAPALSELGGGECGGARSRNRGLMTTKHVF